MTRTSHKKNRPFDFKLIELVRPHPVLYHRLWGGLSTYECMKEKNRIWKEIGEQMKTSPDFCLSRWNNLRNHFQRELRNCSELCPKEGFIRGSTWPYLEVMRFLEGSMRLNRPKSVRLSKRAERRLLLQEQARQVREQMEEEEDDDNNAEYDSNSQEEFLAADQMDHIDPTTADANGTIYVFTDVAQETLADMPTEATAITDELLQERAVNMRRIAELLSEIVGENKVRAERRITAYLCKCQLRALNDEGVDNLSI